VGGGYADANIEISMILELFNILFNILVYNKLLTKQYE
jgi:hypothetical protein